MVNLTINGLSVCVPEGTTILDAACTVDISIPNLCYLREVNEIGACRICVVEIEGIDHLISSCNNVVEEGMVVYTNSPRVREARRINAELILSQHDSHCPTCVRSGNCTLQKVANDLFITETPFHREVPTNMWPNQSPLIREASKCIKCMRCIQICDKIQTLQVWDVEGTGSRTTVDVSLNRNFVDADCALCGQCITHCPVGALRERNDVQRAFDALADPDKITVVQIAPAVRAAWGEAFDLPSEKSTILQMVTALRRMGFDHVFDTNFSADLTVMEEGSEFLDRIKKVGGNKYPLFTSCCPAWVRFMKSQYPDMVENLSTAKSPQQMFGAVIKSYYAKYLGVDPEKIFCVSIMPCVAKKHEKDIPSINDAGAGNDVDLVLTTRELIRMVRAEHMSPISLPEGEFDDPMGISSGAGVIFGTTGGVMEAALRSAYYMVTGKNPTPDAFLEVRGMDGWKEAVYDVSGIPVRVAIASGLGNARKLVDALRAGEVQYDFVEIMACPGGCAGGGGQPICCGKELAEERGAVLYTLDAEASLRFSHENPAIKKLYDEFLDHPLSHKAHELLHTDHTQWSLPMAPIRNK